MNKKMLIATGVVALALGAGAAWAAGMGHRFGRGLQGMEQRISAHIAKAEVKVDGKGEVTKGSIVVKAGGTLLKATDGEVQAVDGGTGKVLWVFRMKGDARRRDDRTSRDRHNIRGA